MALYHTLSALLELTTRAYDCFKRSQIDQKRKLMSFVFANMEMKGEKLYYSMRKPFDVLAKLPSEQEWCKLVDVLRTEYYHDIIALRPSVEHLQGQLMVV